MLPACVCLFLGLMSVCLPMSRKRKSGVARLRSIDLVRGKFPFAQFMRSMPVMTSLRSIRIHRCLHSFFRLLCGVLCCVESWLWSDAALCV